MSMELRENCEREVVIEQFHPKGMGVGRIELRNRDQERKVITLAVAQTIPGEKVRVVLQHVKRRKAAGQLKEVLEPSSLRVRPRCQHFAKCGGCAWQHVNYSAQLKEKEAYVKACLREKQLDAHLVKPVIGMYIPWAYRNKMEFTFSPTGELGLHEPGNYRRVIPLEQCLIAGEEMVRIALDVSRWAAEHQLPGYDKGAHQGLLRHLMVRQSFATGELMVALFATESPNSSFLPSGAVDELKQRLVASHAHLRSFLWLKNQSWADRTQAEEAHLIYGRSYIQDELAGFQYRLGFDTFFQTNPVQAEVLLEEALKMGEPRPEERMVDLFCGVGTFSLPFARRVRYLSGIELSEASVQSAWQNALENGVNNVAFTTADARHGLDQVLAERGRPDLLLLDPPRSGAGGKVMRRIGRAAPKRVIYVSCNPVTLAEDCAELIPFGYRLEVVQPVDLFPHTSHVETVAKLVKC